MYSKLELIMAYVAVGVALVFKLSTPVAFAAEQPFYAGKTINIIAGFAPGGTCDLLSRMNSGSADIADALRADLRSFGDDQSG